MHKYIVEVTDEFTKYFDFNNPDRLHREDGPAIEYENGTKEWYVNGQRHREDGPAAEYENGTKEWNVNGQLHRSDGPAVEYADGSKEWYVNGQSVTEKEFNKRHNSCSGKIVEIDGKKYKLTPA